MKNIVTEIKKIQDGENITIVLDGKWINWEIEIEEKNRWKYSVMG